MVCTILTKEWSDHQATLQHAQNGTNQLQKLSLVNAIHCTFSALDDKALKIQYAGITVQ